MGTAAHGCSGWMGREDARRLWLVAARTVQGAAAPGRGGLPATDTPAELALPAWGHSCPCQEQTGWMWHRGSTTAPELSSMGVMCKGIFSPAASVLPPAPSPGTPQDPQGLAQRSC